MHTFCIPNVLLNYIWRSPQNPRSDIPKFEASIYDEAKLFPFQTVAMKYSNLFWQTELSCVIYYTYSIRSESVKYLFYFLYNTVLKILSSISSEVEQEHLNEMKRKYSNNSLPREKNLKIKLCFLYFQILAIYLRSR